MREIWCVQRYKGLRDIVKLLFLIRGCRHNWLNHVKTSVQFYDDFFILVFLNSYYGLSKHPQL